MSHHTFEIKNLTKIEARANLTIKLEDNEVKEANLGVTEAARYFEAMLRGRKYDEAASITQKICGICSVIHTVGSVKAIENALDIQPSQQTIDLRKLLIMAGQLHSHVVHLYFLTLPDYLGFESILEMSSKRHEEVHRALRLEKLSTDIIRMIGGRPIHPVSVGIGAFTDVPSREKLELILKKFKEMKEDVIKTAKLFISLETPSFENKTRQCALRKDGEYTLYDGRIASTDGIEFDAKDYKKYITEHMKKYSSAINARLKGERLMVGALARLNLNYKYLSDDAKELLNSSGIKLPNFSPITNNLAQAIELVHFIDEGIKLTNQFLGSGLKKETIKVKPKKGEGIMATEAPRGILYYHYILDNKGIIRFANIITPTEQNLESIENDVKNFFPTISHLPKEKITLELEKLIRSYDPCISCPTHFLEVKLVK
jgi:coenzyme F420-reducing hydrogenase alpha subunit